MVQRNMKAPDRRGTWRIASGVLGGLLLFILVAVLSFPSWIRSVEERRWAAMGRQIDYLEARLRSRDSTRVLLRGTPAPGNAWDDYGPLLESLGDPKDYSQTMDFALRLVCTDKEEVRRLVAECPTVMDGLRRGASKSEDRPPTEYWKGTRAWSKTGSLIALAVSQAALWEEEGRGKEAADLLLDTAQFALDLARYPDYLSAASGLYWHRAITRGLADLVEGKLLPPDSAKELSRSLEILDLSLPEQGSGMSGLVETGRSLQSAGSVEGYFNRLEIRERNYSLIWFAYSDRLALVDTFDTACQWAQDAVDSSARPWPEVRDRQMRVLERQIRSKNPISQVMASIQKNLSSGDGPDDPVRECRARVRLVRAALGYGERGEIPSLDDPFGTTIRWSRAGGGLTLWSVGRDGVDHGGVGGWETKNGQDIVLRIPPTTK